MLRYTKDLPFILPNQLFECGRIPGLCARYKRYVGVDLFRCWRLDGRHEQKVRKTHTEIVTERGREESASYPV
jgi:hypothetical protein